jgi:hypothetical protein
MRHSAALSKTLVFCIPSICVNYSFVSISHSIYKLLNSLVCNRIPSFLNYSPEPFIRAIDFRVVLLYIVLYIILKGLN